MGCCSRTVYRTNENHYLVMEKKSPDPHHRRCIDGKITGCGKCVGYCKFHGHPGYLTDSLRKKHDCLTKNCFYYVPKKKGTISFNSMYDALALAL